MSQHTLKLVAHDPRNTGMRKDRVEIASTFRSPEWRAPCRCPSSLRVCAWLIYMVIWYVTLEFLVYVKCRKRHSNRNRKLISVAAFLHLCVSQFSARAARRGELSRRGPSPRKDRIKARINNRHLKPVSCEVLIYSHSAFMNFSVKSRDIRATLYP